MERYQTIGLTAVNASYSHSSLALRCLSKTLEGRTVITHEFTINDRPEKAAAQLYLDGSGLYAFSCYIWNIGFVLDVCRILKAAAPERDILLGGPEVSYDAETVLKQYPFIDYVLCGEGEASLPALLSGSPIETVGGLAYRREGQVRINPPRVIEDLDSLPRLYTKEELLSGLKNKIVYYETSRGCPYRCSYCLSSTSHGVRFFSLTRVLEDFQLFIDCGVPLVKLADRTFNIDRQRTKQMLRYILSHSKTTCFHFEVAADILDDETVALLSGAPKGMFQLEIGVQSTNPETLAAIDRKTDLARLWENVAALQKNNNIHIHLDLIAGLPHEDYNRFTQSFNDVFALRPDMLQLGFLKLLKGTKIRTEADKYGYRFTPQPPYEVLTNDFISYAELLRLKGVEDMVERYYNSHAFEKALEYAIEEYESAYSFFDALASFFQEKGHADAPQSKKSLYEILSAFYCEYGRRDRALFADLLKFDFIRCNPNLALPDWAAKTGDKAFYQAAYAFLASETGQKYIPRYAGERQGELKRAVRVEKFNFDVCGTCNFGESVVVFDIAEKNFAKIVEKF